MKLLCKCGLHFWRYSHGGFNSYYECRTCGVRIVNKGIGGFQPIDTDWLKKHTLINKIPVFRQRLSLEAVFDTIPKTNDLILFLYELSDKLKMVPIEDSLKILDVNLPNNLGTGQHISLNWTTSGVSFYTWHKFNFATLEIYTCKKFKEKVVIDYFVDKLKTLDWKKV